MRASPVPRSAAFVLSMACPLSCRHCLQAGRDGRRTPPGPIPEGELREAVLSLRSTRYRTVCFTGGEPVLHPRVLGAGIDACRQAGLRSMVTTAPSWAGTPSAARRALDGLPPFDTMILSYDNYHLEQLPRTNYETAITAAMDRGIEVAVNISYGDLAERDDLVASLSSLPGKVSGVHAQWVVPSPEIVARGVRVASVLIASVCDLDRLPRSCSAGDVLVDPELRLEFCCWSNTAADPPFRSLFGRGGGLAEAVRGLEQDRAFQALQRTGLLQGLGREGRVAVAALARGRSFVNECHLCLFLMERRNRGTWDRYVRGAPAPAGPGPRAEVS